METYSDLGIKLGGEKVSNLRKIYHFMFVWHHFSVSLLWFLFTVGLVRAVGRLWDSFPPRILRADVWIRQSRQSLHAALGNGEVGEIQTR